MFGPWELTYYLSKKCHFQGEICTALRFWCPFFFCSKSSKLVMLNHPGTEAKSDKTLLEKMNRNQPMTQPSAGKNPRIFVTETFKIGIIKWHHFLFKQLLFSEVGFTAFTNSRLKSTLLNKSCSNQKNNATLLFQF